MNARQDADRLTAQMMRGLRGRSAVRAEPALAPQQETSPVHGVPDSTNLSDGAPRSRGV